MGTSGEFQTTKIDYDTSETKFDYDFKTRKAESSYDFGHETSYFEADDLTNTAWLNDDECQILKQSIGNEYKKHLNSARSTLEESSQRYQDLKKILEEHGYHESMLLDEDTSEIKETVDIDALKQGDISLDSIVKSFGFENLESYLSQYQSAFQKYQKDLFCVQQWEFLLANLDYELDIKSESYFHYANLVNVAEEDILPFIYGTYIDKGTKNINVGFDYTKFQSDHPAIDPVSAIAKVQEMFGEDIEIKGVENAELVQELAKIQSEPCCNSIAQYYRFCWGEKSPSEASQYIQNMENVIHNYCGQVKAKEFLNKLGTDNNAIETILNHLKIASHGIGRGYEDVFKNIDYVLESFIKDNRTISADEYEQMYLIQALSSKQDKIDNGLVLQNLNGDIYSAQKNSIIDYTKNYGIFSDDVAQMSTSVGNMIPSMLLSMMNKKMGLVTMAISSAGGAYHNSMVQGHGKIASAVYGTTSGLIETLLEKKLGGMPFLGDVQVTNLSSLFQASGKEFGEEFLETYVDNIAQSIILNEEFDGKEVAKEALQSGVYGMINSGFANATQLAIHNSLSSLSPKNAPIETFTDVDTKEISKISENTKEDFQTNLVDKTDTSYESYQPDSSVETFTDTEHSSIEDGVLTKQILTNQDLTYNHVYNSEMEELLRASSLDEMLDIISKNENLQEIRQKILIDFRKKIFRPLPSNTSRETLNTRLSVNLDDPNSILAAGYNKEGYYRWINAEAQGYPDVYNAILNEDIFMFNTLKQYARCHVLFQISYDEFNFFKTCDYQDIEIQNQELSEFLGQFFDVLQQKNVENPICIKDGIARLKKEYEQHINQHLIQPEDLKPVSQEDLKRFGLTSLDTDVKVVDAGVDFYALIKDMGYAGRVGNDYSQMWNQDESKYLYESKSIISNNCISTVSSSNNAGRSDWTKNWMVGFSSLHDLQLMSSDDVGQTTNAQGEVEGSLQYGGNITGFASVDKTINNTGQNYTGSRVYNEIVDKKYDSTNQKFHPDYVLLICSSNPASKFSQNITERYQNAVQVAKELNIENIVLVDVDKCLEHQLDTIQNLVDEFKENHSQKTLDEIIDLINCGRVQEYAKNCFGDDFLRDLLEQIYDFNDPDLCQLIDYSLQSINSFKYENFQNLMRNFKNEKGKSLQESMTPLLEKMACLKENIPIQEKISQLREFSSDEDLKAIEELENQISMDSKNAIVAFFHKKENQKRNQDLEKLRLTTLDNIFKNINTIMEQYDIGPINFDSVDSIDQNMEKLRQMIKNIQDYEPQQKPRTEIEIPSLDIP